jgi:hypothetical protein
MLTFRVRDLSRPISDWRLRRHGASRRVYVYVYIRYTVRPVCSYIIYGTGTARMALARTAVRPTGSRR